MFSQIKIILGICKLFRYGVVSTFDLVEDGRSDSSGGIAQIHPTSDGSYTSGSVTNISLKYIG